MNVSRKLNAYAKEQGLDINKVRITFALERLVARIETDKKLSESLVYKGGFVLLKTTSTNRYTVDIDALAQRIIRR
ncbi:MAG: hypothetical protein H6618_05955 [Deltaproteobacteria bacterium]|nr:hypothetical protein [Deltaproteobacteria bacterium]